MSDDNKNLHLISTSEAEELDSTDAANYDFGFEIRPALRLGYIEQIIKEKHILKPAPSRQSLIKMIRKGELEGKLVRNMWIVYEDSFQAWVHALSETSEQATIQKPAV
ncbi:MAG: hypothetical protein ICV60_05700 [Pyrinomonadaceae bacterium]|nr:hypothetical protein [Pyrinomonadaceae bacterium]